MTNPTLQETTVTQARSRVSLVMRVVTVCLELRSAPRVSPAATSPSQVKLRACPVKEELSLLTKVARLLWTANILYFLPILEELLESFTSLRST